MATRAGVGSFTNRDMTPSMHTATVADANPDFADTAPIGPNRATKKPAD
jgi:hypothetical protein